MKLKVDKKAIAIAFLLLPFFEIGSLDLLIEYNFFAGFLSLVTIFCSVMRSGITIGSIAYCFIKRIRFRTHILLFVILFYFSIMVTKYYNGSFYLNYMIGNFSYIGLALICEVLSNKNYKSFINGSVLIFGVISFSSALFSFIRPEGFFVQEKFEQSIFLLGGKNAALMFYLMYILLLFIKDEMLYKRIRLSTTLKYLVLFVSLFVFRSSGSIISFIMILPYFLFSQHGHLINKSKIARICLTLGVLVSVVTVIGIKFSPLKILSVILHKGITFNARTTLWEAGIEYFKLHPWIGNGNNLYLWNGGVQSHVHNFYLDILVKNGVFPFIVIVLLMIYVIKLIGDESNYRLQTLKYIVTLSFIFKSSIDDMSVYLFIFFVFIISYSISKKWEFNISKNMYFRGRETSSKGAFV